jgi:hypothetical protein
MSVKPCVINAVNVIVVAVLKLFLLAMFDLAMMTRLQLWLLLPPLLLKLSIRSLRVVLDLPAVPFLFSNLDSHAAVSEAMSTVMLLLLIVNLTHTPTRAALVARMFLFYLTI